MRNFIIALSRNTISLIGVALVTVSAVLIVTLFAIELAGFVGNPYIGILAYLILPAFLLLGLVLIPIGISRERRRARRARARGEPEPRFPVIDLNVGRVRTWVLTFIVLTTVNVVILATATFKGVEVMETTEFCGTTCHSVMQPEHTVYDRSPHSRVKCVDCHIGPGADWFVKSKLSGAWQVVSVAFDLYPRPIPTPVHDLRPARETCEQCHWPDKFVGDRLWVSTQYGNDEENTETNTVLLLRVGGIQGRQSAGIHWHVDPDIRVRYRSDEKRETIYDVELTEADGTKKVYVPSDGVPEDAADSWRTMDCVDCHNRPTHVYRLPEEEVDLALLEGRISRALPFVRREGVRLLKEDYPSHDGARSGIAEGIREYYSTNHPDVLEERSTEIEQAGRVLGDIWATNVFPEMSVTWGTYPDHGGHETSDGCFRCHNDDHTTADGEVISMDCDTCHSLLAIEEEDPEILAQLNP